MKSDTTGLLLLAVFALAGCKPDPVCSVQLWRDPIVIEKHFTLCMQQAAQVKSDGSHDNRYDLVEQCRYYADEQTDRECWTKKRSKPHD